MILLSKNEENNKKNKLLFPTEKGLEIYPFIIRENEYSNSVALKGFDKAEIAKFAKDLEK